MTDLDILARRPPAEEYHPGYAPYLDALDSRGEEPLDLAGILDRQPAELAAALGGFSDREALHRYAPEKWSVKEVVAHLADVERVMSYRLLRVSRGDGTPLPGFDENAWVAAMEHDRRPLGDHLDEFQVARTGSLALLRGLAPACFGQTVVASGHPVSGRALAWILAGHLEHHLRILHERYGVPVPGQNGELSS
ncbi:DinB family protein [soil metagenome]